MNRRYILTVFVVVGFLGLAACSESSTEPEQIDEPVLLQVTPEGDATLVHPDSSITIEFSHPMGMEMEMYVVLHDGDTSGPLVAGSWTWSEDRMKLTFQPDSPLKPATTYAIHIGGGMTDASGNHINYEEHGMDMGGQWISQQMLGNWGGGGMMGGGMGSMMGPGWQHHNGSYGMVFYFTTV